MRSTRIVNFLRALKSVSETLLMLAKAFLRPPSISIARTGPAFPARRSPGRLAPLNIPAKSLSCSQFPTLLGGHQHGSAFVFHEERDEFRRFGLAFVPPNDVDIIRCFLK